jgi:signal transduction histidine kinase/ActR/RegA family two-component response regulator
MKPEKKITDLQHQIEELETELKLAIKDSIDANRKKTMFLANMSHEIRTPMNSILGIYTLLSQTTLTEEQKEFLEIIHIASINLLTIINDILDLSKIEAGQLKLEENPFSLNDEILQVVKLLSLKAKGKGIELSSKIDATIPGCLIGDPVRLKQILINLTNNAIKFTNEGEVVISAEIIGYAESEKEYLPDGIDVSKLQENQRVLKFEVTDTGIGMSADEQQSLFNEFAQMENPLIMEYEGTGLGLSISLNLTQLMNGRMGVFSEKGKGSTFWFTLLFTVGDDALLKEEARETARPPKKSKPLSILLVEDNLLNQKFAVTTLQRDGHTVDIAENGKVALEKFYKKVYDLVIMDIAMPIMDGLEAARQIRTYEREKLAKMSEKEANHFCPVSIVAITAHIMVTDRETCLAAGMNDYLAKPYRPTDLIKIIERLQMS